MGQPAKDIVLSKRTFLVLCIAMLMAALLLVGIFPLATPRIFLNHRRAVASIQDLNLAEHDYALQHSNAGYACSLSDLGELGLVDRVLASGTKAAYRFEIHCLKNGSQKAVGYTVTAVPTIPGTTGVYALCADQSGEIWYSENGSTSDCLAKHKPIEQKYR